MHKRFKWYFKERNIKLLVAFFYPFGLYLMFKYTYWDKRIKYGLLVFYSIITLTILSLLVYFIVTYDHEKYFPSEEEILICEEYTGKDCIQNGITSDISSISNIDNFEIMFHDFETVNYPHSTVELSITKPSSDDSYSDYMQYVYEILSKINIDELKHVGYSYLDISVESTYHDEDLMPHTEKMITYRFFVDHYIHDNWDVNEPIDIDHEITFKHTILD